MPVLPTESLSATSRARWENRRCTPTRWTKTSADRPHRARRSEPPSTAIPGELRAHRRANGRLDTDALGKVLAWGKRADVGQELGDARIPRIELGVSAGGCGCDLQRPAHRLAE